MSQVQKILDKIQGQFNPDAASGLDIVFQFVIDDSDSFYLSVANSECDLVKGTHEDPTVTLRMSEETLSEIAQGELGGMQAFMTGKLKAEGNIMMATKLSDLFGL